MDPNRVRLLPMTDGMYRRFFRAFENDPDVCLPGQPYRPYVYSEEAVERYIRRQKEQNRIPLAILWGDEPVGEILLKNIVEKTCATLGITLKNAGYKDRGIGTEAERQAVRYAFRVLDIPVVYADTVRTNARSQHVLEKVGFTLIREDRDYKYYRLERDR